MGNKKGNANAIKRAIIYFRFLLIASTVISLAGNITAAILTPNTPHLWVAVAVSSIPPLILFAGVHGLAVAVKAGISGRVYKVALFSVLGIVLAAFVLSFANLHKLLVMIGYNSALAPLGPIIIDAAIGVATMMLVALSQSQKELEDSEDSKVTSSQVNVIKEVPVQKENIVVNQAPTSPPVVSSVPVKKNDIVDNSYVQEDNKKEDIIDHTFNNKLDMRENNVLPEILNNNVIIDNNINNEFDTSLNGNNVHENEEPENAVLEKDIVNDEVVQDLEAIPVLGETVNSSVNDNHVVKNLPSDIINDSVVKNDFEKLKRNIINDPVISNNNFLRGLAETAKIKENVPKTAFIYVVNGGSKNQLALLDDVIKDNADRLDNFTSNYAGLRRDVSHFTVPKLKDLAKEDGHINTHKMKKDDLVKVLEKV